MMKRLLLLFLLVETTGFSQQVDSLTLSYYTGHRGTYTVDGKDIRGTYEKSEKIRYRKKRRCYRIKSFVSVERFWERDQPNLLEDSVKNPGAFMHRKLPGKKFDEYLVTILSLKKDSIFPYEIKDVPQSFLKENSLTRKSGKIQIDSLVRRTFGNQLISNVTGYFWIHFHYRGVSYDVYKDSNNKDWRIYISGNENDLPVHFIHFAFDTFLLNELPKKFSGRKVLD